MKILMAVILRSGGLSIPWRLMTISTFRALFVLLIAGLAGLSALAQDKSSASTPKDTRFV
jgi:hypothetical protein